MWQRDGHGQGQEIRVERPGHEGSEVLACYPEAQGRSERKAFPEGRGTGSNKAWSMFGGSPKLERGQWKCQLQRSGQNAKDFSEILEPEI